MNKGNIYSLIVGFIALLIVGCTAKLQTYDLSEEYATSLHYQPAEEGDSKPEEKEESNEMVGVPARNFYGGDLKRGGIWWASKGITLEKGDIFVFSFVHIGPDSIPFGATNPSSNPITHPFGATFPPLNLIKEPVMLKVSARAEGQDGSTPVLHLQVDDATGVQANAKRPSNKIENSEEFKDYYFDMRDIYMQSEPDKRKVNGAMINSVKFFVNPGEEPGYTGKIFIREIKIVPAAQ